MGAQWSCQTLSGRSPWSAEGSSKRHKTVKGKQSDYFLYATDMAGLSGGAIM